MLQGLRAVVSDLKSGSVISLGEALILFPGSPVAAPPQTLVHPLALGLEAVEQSAPTYPSSWAQTTLLLPLARAGTTNSPLSHRETVSFYQQKL